MLPLIRSNHLERDTRFVRDRWPGHTVYVHCSAGMNRSPSTVVAYLHWTQGMTLDEALDVVMQRRFCDPYMDAIRQATANQAAKGGSGTS